MTKIAGALALLVAGAAAGYAAGTYRSGPAAVMHDTPMAATPAGATLTSADIAAVVRTELAHMPREVVAPAATASAAPQPAANDERSESPKQMSNPEARSRAEAVVRDAIHFAKWTEYDRTRLQEELGHLTAEDWLAITTPLAMAINSGKLTAEAFPPY